MLLIVKKSHYGIIYCKNLSTEYISRQKESKRAKAKTLQG